jgi:hypothetical protein
VAEELAAGAARSHPHEKEEVGIWVRVGGILIFI